MMERIHTDYNSRTKKLHDWACTSPIVMITKSQVDSRQKIMTVKVPMNLTHCGKKLLTTVMIKL
jgi:hypothetical protein